LIEASSKLLGYSYLTLIAKVMFYFGPSMLKY